MTFVSKGLLQDNVDVLIQRGDACVEDDVIGEIHIRSSLQAAECAGTGPKNVAGFASTGEYGFISSQNLHLYITAGLGDKILLEKRCISAAALERAIESANKSLTKAAVISVEGNYGQNNAVIVAET